MQLPAFRKLGTKYSAVTHKDSIGNLYGLTVDTSEQFHEVSNLVIRGYFEQGEPITAYDFAVAMGKAQVMLENDFNAISESVAKQREEVQP